MSSTDDDSDVAPLPRRGGEISSSESVIDASAALALVFDEPGAERVAERIANGAVISAVNLSEVGTVLIRRGLDWERILTELTDVLDVAPATESDAREAVGLYPSGEEAGLSLGDRHCLALAKRLGVPAVTTERIWPTLTLDVEVDFVRDTNVE